MQFTQFNKPLFFKNLILSLSLVSAGIAQTPSEAKPPAIQAENYKMVFDEEFNKLDLSPDGTGINTWYPGIWFNHKHFPLSNVSVSDSNLSLTWRSTQESSDTSIETLARDKHHATSWRYGYFEVRAKWDPVPGAWPTIWMIPVQDARGEDIYNGVKESGELDIFEGQGALPRKYFGTLHDWTGGTHDSANKNNAYWLPPDNDFSQFHVYSALWVPGKVTWFLDGKPLHSENTPAIFDKQDFFMILGMSEGVNWRLGDRTGVTAEKMKFTVDWVRVWQKDSATSTK